MIVAPLKLHAYRVLTPRWAFQPHSGAGAAKAGGRFNRPGQHAVYLALDTETAIAEFAQAKSVLEPGTIATYRLELASAVDFRAGYERSWDPLWQDWDCEWKRLSFMDDIDPPTWLMGDEVQAVASALVFPSTKRPGGINVVVYPSSLRSGDVFQVHDPEGALPKSARSWD